MRRSERWGGGGRLWEGAAMAAGRDLQQDNGIRGGHRANRLSLSLSLRVSGGQLKFQSWNLSGVETKQATKIPLPPLFFKSCHIFRAWRRIPSPVWIFSLATECSSPCHKFQNYLSLWRRNWLWIFLSIVGSSLNSYFSCYDFFVAISVAPSVAKFHRYFLLF